MKENPFSKCSALQSLLSVAFVALALSNLFACAYPGIKESAINPDAIMDFVDENYDRSTISYCGEAKSPNAILFDPKNDEVTLKGDGWYSVESKAQLDEMIREMISRYLYHNEFPSGPCLFEIQSEEGRVIGYLYSVHVVLTIKRDGNDYRLSPITESDIRDDRRFYSIKGAGHD